MYDISTTINTTTYLALVLVVCLSLFFFFFFFNDTATTEIYTLSLHDALPIFAPICQRQRGTPPSSSKSTSSSLRSEEHTSELQSRRDLVCRLLLEKKKKEQTQLHTKDNKKITVSCRDNNQTVAWHNNSYVESE